jgi:hypothetical protein
MSWVAKHQVCSRHRVNEKMVKVSVSRTCLIAASLTCLTSGVGIARSTPRLASKAFPFSNRSVVQLNGLNEPLLILRDALNQKPRALQFQVKWFDMVLSQDYDSTALYDRNRHTLIFDCHGHWDGGRMHERAIYIGVTDGIVSRAAKAHAGQMQADFLADGFRAYFETLPQFGAKLHVKYQAGL